MWVLDGFRLTGVDGGPCLGLSSCLSRTCGGGCRHGTLGVSWEGCCCRPVSQGHDVSHSFILSPVVPSVDEVFQAVFTAVEGGFVGRVIRNCLFNFLLENRFFMLGD